ncbi:hypothetical protein PSAR109036_14195 [Psychrobacter arenosus]|uniref:hypothetical protein n=1 Tax=Psychrobacter arenosus TaxID=256326 RepID=UPI001918D58A|nr:hypothetical protein [Psychrobacter arenosus]
MTEENNANRKRKILDKFIEKLNQEDPQMYYASTSEVARAIHLMVREHTNRLPVEDQLLVKHMSLEEIEMLLGFHEKK